MHKVQRLWLVAFFWLLGLLAVSAGGSSITFNYDCGIRELTAYDAQFPPASVYDGAAILTANECWHRPAEIRAPFIKFAEFLAADSGAFANYMRQAQTLDVSTAPNTAVFYSGPGNRALAEQFATANGGTTLEMTPGGAWLDQQQLFNTAQSGLTTEQAAQVWSTLSQRFAQGASGNAVGFVNGARAGSIFNTVEYPTLVNNPSIVNVITGGH
jgi:hypothetical protein